MSELDWYRPKERNTGLEGYQLWVVNRVGVIHRYFSTSVVLFLALLKLCSVMLRAHLPVRKVCR